MSAWLILSMLTTARLYARESPRPPLFGARIVGRVPRRRLLLRRGFHVCEVRILKRVLTMCRHPA